VITVPICPETLVKSNSLKHPIGNSFQSAMNETKTYQPFYLLTVLSSGSMGGGGWDVEYWVRGSFEDIIDVAKDNWDWMDESEFTIELRRFFTDEAEDLTNIFRDSVIEDESDDEDEEDEENSEDEHEVDNDHEHQKQKVSREKRFRHIDFTRYASYPQPEDDMLVCTTCQIFFPSTTSKCSKCGDGSDLKSIDEFS
jgi:hypothetical protein